MKWIIIIVLLTVSFVGFSQPNTGIKIGANYTWMKYDFHPLERKPAMGLDVGYAWRINVSPKVSISLEAIYSRFCQYLPQHDMASHSYISKKQGIYYITAPVGVNYMFAKRFYASAGYQFGYNLYDLLADNNFTNEYMHAGYVGGGFHTRYFDVVGRYVHDFNTDYGQLRSLQLGIVVGLGGKSKKNKVE